MKNLLLFSLALVLPVTAADAAPTGRIGFIGPTGAKVWNLVTGKSTSIPNATKAENLTLSPRGDAIFFVPSGKKSKPPESQVLLNGFVSRAPYTRSTTMRSLQGIAPYSFHWNPSGSSLYLNGYEWMRVFTPASGQLKKVPFKPSSFDGPIGFDIKGRHIGYCTEESVVIRDVNTGKERVIFSTKKPKPLFDALRRADNPKNVKNLLEGEESLKEENPFPYSQWQLAGPVLSPDGNRAYFTSNAGTGFGAAGNGMQGYFSCNLKTGVISVLSKVGLSFGRPPEMSISPDGKRLLAVSSVHSNAADNSSVALVIDLETQNSREIMFKIPGSKDRANFYGGSAWSPDGKFLALSAYFYDADRAMQEVADAGSDNWPATRSSAWKTAIFESATGKIWGIKLGMRAPSWSR
jgi:hypothetical protein